MSQQIGDSQQETIILTQIGRFLQDASRYGEALTFFYQALEKAQKMKNLKQEGEILSYIGEIRYWIGDIATAARWYEKAYETAKAARSTIIEARTLAMLLLVDFSLGKSESLKEHAVQADKTLAEILQWLSTVRQKAATRQTSDADQIIEHVSAEARLIQSTGIILSMVEDENLVQEGIKLLNEVLQLHQMLRTRDFLKETAKDLYYLGRAYRRLRQYEEALRSFQQAEAIGRSFNSPEVHWILNTMGQVREGQGRLQEALNLYTQATEVVEKVSFHQRLEDVRTPLRGVVFNVYLNILRVLYKLHLQDPKQPYIEQAFLYYEKGKARALLDLLAEAQVHLREGIDPASLKEKERISTRISRLHRKLAAPELTKEQEKPLLTTLAEQEQALQALEVHMAVANPKYAELTSPQAVDIPQVQAILDKETLLLEYVLGDERSFLWAITQDGIQGYELPAQEKIDRQVEQYLSTLKVPLYGRDEIKRHRELGRGLYQALVQPVATQLQGKNKLIIVPDGNLYYLPFETLIADDAGSIDEKSKEPPAFQSVPYLVKDYTVTYTPSASVLVTLEKTRKTHSRKETPSQAPLLAFGDPLYEATPEPRTVALNVRGAYEERGGGFQRLEHAAKEVEKIAGVYGITLPSDAVNLREKATEKNLREVDLTRYRVLHFATHAILSDEVKWITQPALVLSLAGTDDTYDGFLQMGEIFNLRLNADLVVLSACDTGKGKLLRGEGIVGLTRAFMYAGTPSVVASLWKVNDQSTSLFMEFFYRNLQDGQSKAEALRQAKKQLMQTQVWSETLKAEQSLAAPYFWAPFILVGSGN